TVTFSVATPPSGEFQLQSMLSSLSFPVAMAYAPDGRLFYNELTTGRVRVVSPQWVLQTTPVHTFQIATGGEQGLLGIAVDPDFAVNHDLYVFHSVPGNPVRNQVVRITETNGVGANPTVIIPNLPAGTYHNGGNLHFGPDGKLYVTIGDTGGSSNSQNASSLAGKILRYNKDGTIPTDNPTAGSAVYAMGLLNSFDFTFHSDTGDLWATENGASTDDEVNRIVAGGNYGWPIKTGVGNTDPQYLDALIEFTPTIAPTGIVSISENSAYPEQYHSSLLFADYNSGRIHRLALAGTGLTGLGGYSVIYSGGQGGLLDLVEGPDGFVYASSGSGIFRLAPSTTIPFQLSNVSATGVTETTATITWSTSVSADTQVEYGLTTAYGLASTLVPNLVSSHTVNLTGLTPGVLYHYRVTSRDQFGRPVASADQTFLTPQFAILPNSVDVLSDLAQDGTFFFTEARLEALFGALADGPYALRFQAEDARGNARFSDLFFTLDTTPPAPPTWDLAPGSDTEVLGDQKTTEALVTVEGQAEPGALITLVELAWTTTAGPTGAFSLPAVPLVLGPNPFTIRVTDLAGNVSDLARTVTRMAPPELNTIGNRTVDESVLLQFTATATDLDSPLSGLTYSLADGAVGQAPAGASIGLSTGGFTWTPTEAQGPGTYTFDVMVADNGLPALSDHETITVTVNEVNAAPTAVPDPTGATTEDTPLTINVVGNDTDVDGPLPLTPVSSVDGMEAPGASPVTAGSREAAGTVVVPSRISEAAHEVGPAATAPPPFSRTSLERDGAGVLARSAEVGVLRAAADPAQLQSSLTLNLSLAEPSNTDQPLNSPSRPWLQDFVVSSSALEDPNRDLAVTLS
ncbi:MAG: PQQ-dependent sugar dehydrogenase, partial [Nitrospirae bacterium]|nr:PQQ-dependent sugar dehydrogenase [Nitrospirota bacterium]